MTSLHHPGDVMGHCLLGTVTGSVGVEAALSALIVEGVLRVTRPSQLRRRRTMTGAPQTAVLFQGPIDQAQGFESHLVLAHLRGGRTLPTQSKPGQRARSLLLPPREILPGLREALVSCDGTDQGPVKMSRPIGGLPRGEVLPLLR